MDVDLIEWIDKEVKEDDLRRELMRSKSRRRD